MSANQFTVKSFVDRMKDVDPDFRQMALFDLTQELGRNEFTLSDTDQNSVVTHVLECFGEKELHSEVHSNAVRCLGPLVGKISESKGKTICNSLTNSVIFPNKNAKGEQIQALRENAAMGLKVIVEHLSDATIAIGRHICEKLIQGIQGDVAEAIRMDIFDITSDVFQKFGSDSGVSHFFTYIIDVALRDFSGSNSLRKKAVSALTHIARSCGDQEFNTMVEFTTTGLNKSRGEQLRRYIQLCNSLSRAAASRFGHSVKGILDFFFKELRRLDELDEEQRESPDSDEIRENILQAMESFIARCPLFVTEQLPEIISTCCRLLSWDPNYCETEDEDEENDDEEEEEDMMDDDGDISWKVRKSAARCLTEAIIVRPDQLQLFMSSLIDSSSGSIISYRLRERVETVRLEILRVLQVLVEACKVCLPAYDRATGSSAISSVFAGGSFRTVITARPEAKRITDAREVLVKALLMCTKHRSPKVRLSAFTLLRDIYIIGGHEMIGFIPDCINSVKNNLKNDGRGSLPQMRPAVLNFSRVLIDATSKAQTDPMFRECIVAVENMFPAVVECTNDRFFKVVVAALQVCKEGVSVVRLSGSAEGLARLIFGCILERLSTGDADQEVKRAAIEASAMTLRYLEDILVKAVPQDLAKMHQQLLVMLRSDATRLTAAHALHDIVRCRVEPDILKEAAVELTQLLRRSDRHTRESALTTLTALIPIHHSTFNKEIFSSIIDQLCNENSGLLSDTELFVTSLSLQLARNIVSIPGQGAIAMPKLVPCVLTLLAKSQLQGNAVHDAGRFFKTLAMTANSDPTLLANVMQAAKTGKSANAANIGVAVGAVLSEETNSKRCAATVDELCVLSQQDVIGLACIGELGHYIDLTTLPSALNALTNGLASEKEELKTAASTAFGRASAGTCGKNVLGVVMKNVSTTQKASRYYYFRALKETVQFAFQQGVDSSSLASTAERQRMKDLLISSTLDCEDGVSDIIAECIGRLAVADISTTLTHIAKVVGNTQNLSSVVTLLSSVKYTVSNSNKNQDEVLKQHLPMFVDLLDRSKDIEIRKVLLQLLTTSLHSKPHILDNDTFNAKWLPHILAETKVDNSLVTEIDLGPFKHRVDKGLDARKISFECLNILLDSLLNGHGPLAHRSESLECIVEPIIKGMSALSELDMDINCSCRVMVVKMLKISSTASIVVQEQYLDLVSSHLQKSIAAKAAANQEDEKVTDCVRHSIATARRIEALASTKHSNTFNNTMNAARSSKEYNQSLQVNVD